MSFCEPRSWGSHVVFLRPLGLRLLVCTEKAGPVVQQGRALQETFFRRLARGLEPEDLAAFRRCLEGFRRNLSQMTQEDA